MLPLDRVRRPRSAAMKLALAPAAVISSTISAQRALSRASCSATTRAMPDLVPVTTARRPSRSLGVTTDNGVPSVVMFMKIRRANRWRIACTSDVFCRASDDAPTTPLRKRPHQPNTIYTRGGRPNQASAIERTALRPFLSTARVRPAGLPRRRRASGSTPPHRLRHIWRESSQPPHRPWRGP